MERQRGAYRVLESAAPYALLQRLIGAPRVHEALVSTFLKPFPGMRVLDIGAGTGSLRPALGDCDYTALEPNADYVAALRHSLCEGEGTVIHGGTRDLSHVEGPFDRVLMMALLHHLDDATATAACRDAAALLAPGGRFITLDNCLHDGQGRVARRLALMDRGANVRTIDGYRGVVSEAFTSVRVYLSTDLLRVPYSHVWMVGEGPAPSTPDGHAGS